VLLKNIDYYLIKLWRAYLKVMLKNSLILKAECYNIMVQQGNPNSSFPAQKQPYVKETRNGKVIDKNGNPTTGKSPDAHIPKDQYKYDR